MAATEKALKLGFILSATDKMSRVIDEAVKKSTSKLTAFERATGSASRSLLKAGGLMVGAGSAIGAATFGIAKNTAAYGDAALKNSQAVGVNIEDWQKLAYAAKMANVEETELSGALVKLNKQVTDAANGSKIAGKTFTDLGIKLKDAKGNLRAPNEIFAELSGIFARVEDGTAKTALAYELFGRSGTKLIPLLNGGKEGLEAMGAEAVAMGLVLSKEAAQASEQFNDNLARVGSTVRGLTMQFGTVFLPVLDNLIQKVSGVTGRLSGWLKQNPALASTISKVVLTLSALLITLGGAAVAMGTVLFIISKFTAAWRGIIKLFKLAAVGIHAVKNGMVLFRLQYAALIVWQKSAAAAQALFNASLFGCPVVWIVAAVAAIGAAVYLLIKHWDKVAAFFRKLWQSVKNLFRNVWEWIKKLLLNYTPHGLIIKHWQRLTAWFGNLWGGVKQAFRRAWESIKKLLFNYTPHGLIIKHWQRLTAWFGNLWGGVKQTFRRAWDSIKQLLHHYTPHGLIIKHWESITAWFSNLWANVKAVFVGAWEAIASFFRSLNPVEWISGIWENVGAFFADLKNRFFEWGKEIIQGLINGVKAFATKAVESVKNIGKSIAGKFKALLGINSPSRLFMQYGVNITEGLSGGIDQGGETVNRSTASLAENAARGVQTSLQTHNTNNPNTLNSFGGLTLNYAPTVTINGANLPDTVKDDFLKMLRSHREEIIEMIERYNDNKQRLAF